MEVVIAKNKQELERLEGVIQENIGAFYEVGMALMKIRDQKYYHDVLGFKTFEEYCKSKWDFASNYARRLIASAETVENIKSVPMGTIPQTERQARSLARLGADQQLIAWQKAVETAPDGKVTGAHVYKIVKGMTMEQEKPRSAPQPQIPSDAMQLSGIAINQLQRITADDPRREDALRRVELWLLKNKKGGKK